MWQTSNTRCTRYSEYTEVPSFQYGENEYEVNIKCIKEVSGSSSDMITYFYSFFLKNGKNKPRVNKNYI